MFESDDFDKVLSQFDFPDEHQAQQPELISTEETKMPSLFKNSNILPIPDTLCEVQKRTGNSGPVISLKISNNDINKMDNILPKHTKRKIINSYFDHKNKRKFPGPAGMLTGDLEEPKDESICHMELFSQDIDFKQNNLRGDLFTCPLWLRLLADAKDWNLLDINSIKGIKQQAITGNLIRRKAQTVTAFVEAVDRSATDPLIILRDMTGTMKCTLHRDAWSTFSPYLGTEYCALILWKPTVLTTGSAFKNHYLNITLSNILALYSSAVLTEDTDSKSLPDGYSIIYEGDFTVIKTENYVQSFDASMDSNNAESGNDMFDGLDSIFSDEIF